MGPGGSQEAEYTLKGSVPAGTYHVICDAIIIRAVDVTFDLVHRRGATDVTLATWMQHFEPIGGGTYTAQAYEYLAEAPALDFEPGDQLIFRYTGANSTTMMAFIPNGDGAITGGRIPNITLPR
ncbi:MAG: hypothetical protein H0X17_01495 [Deltaproteobacteria bacterium]|nr:hypothetical protein [Deltaproteobacteria bacterium]